MPLTDAALLVLRGDTPLMLFVPRISRIRPRCSQTKHFGGIYDRQLFARSRKLRTAIADEADIPPRVVFHRLASDLDGRAAAS